MTATATATIPRSAPRPSPRPRARALSPVPESRDMVRSSLAAGSRSRRPATEARPARALELAAPPRRRTGARVSLALSVMVLFGSLLAVAGMHSILVSGQAKIDELDQQIRLENRALDNERLRLAMASSPERLAAEAERMGLVVAPRQTWIRPGSDEEPVVTGDSVAPTSNRGSDEGSTDAGSSADGDREGSTTGRRETANTGASKSSASTGEARR